RRKWSPRTWSTSPGTVYGGWKANRRSGAPGNLAKSDRSPLPTALRPRSRRLGAQYRNSHRKTAPDLDRPRTWVRNTATVTAKPPRIRLSAPRLGRFHRAPADSAVPRSATRGKPVTTTRSQPTRVGNLENFTGERMPGLEI